LISLLTNLFIGLSVGANVLAARYYGAKNDEELNKTLHTSMLLSIISGVFLTFVGIGAARVVLGWMSTPKEVLNLAVVYLRIYFLGMTATMIYNFGSAVLRAIGDTKRPLYYLCFSGVVNVVLNLFFVIVLKMGVAGVAAATAISQCISAGLIIRCLLKEEGGMKLDLKKLHIYKDKLIKILEIGLPAGFQGILFSLSNVVIQSSINTYGKVIVAGNSAASNIEGFVYFAMNAFYQATISFVSQNMGAGNYKRIRKILWAGLGCVVVVGIALGNGAYFFGNTLLSFYSTSAPVIQAGLVRLSLISTTYALCGVMDVMVGALRGIGYSVMPMIVSLVGACGLRLLWLATVWKIDRYHTVKVIYLSYPISWIITFLVHVICFRWAIKKLYRIHGVN